MGEAKLRREKPLISVLIPERGRPEALKALLWSLVTHDGDDQRYEILVAIDEDDSAHHGVEPVESRHVRYFTWPRPLTLGQKINMLAREASDADFYWFCSNDRLMLTEGWPAKFREAVASLPNGIGVAYPKDPLHPDHAAFPIVTRQMEKAVGFVMPPCYPYWFIDTHWDQLGVLLGVRFEIPVELAVQEGTDGTIDGRYELPFWVDFFHAITPVRLKEGIQLIEAAWGKDHKEGAAALADLGRRQQICAARVAHLKNPAFLDYWGSKATEPPYPAYAEVKKYAEGMIADLAKQAPRKLRVAIATPSGRSYEAGCANCIAALAAYSAQAGIDLSLINVQTSAITHGRNSTVQIAMENNCDKILWVDSDMTFPPNTLVRLLQHQKDIVGATYNKRTPPYTTLGRLKGQNPGTAALNAGGLHEAELLPGGLLLIDMNVYKALKWPWYAECYRWEGDDNRDAFRRQMKEYFTSIPSEKVLDSLDGTAFGDWIKENYEVAVDKGSQERYFSEDLFLIVKARENGFSVWCCDFPNRQYRRADHYLRSSCGRSGGETIAGRGRLNR
jgi:hypothetical protein